MRYGLTGHILWVEDYGPFMGVSFSISVVGINGPKEFSWMMNEIPQLLVLGCLCAMCFCSKSPSSDMAYFRRTVCSRKIEPEIFRRVKGREMRSEPENILLHAAASLFYSIGHYSLRAV